MATSPNTASFETALNITHIAADIEVSDVSNAVWKNGESIFVDRYWSGAEAPAGRCFSAILLWSDTSLYILFTANQEVPLIASDRPDLTKKSIGLWDRDVCEIFVAPNAMEPRKYFEFEVAPTGEWLDVALDATSGTRIPDWDYRSEFKSFASVEPGKVISAMKIPWTAFGRMPKVGDVWLGNLFRCVGQDPGRGYLAWRPTFTNEPNFHVPERFGEFRFVA
ncbi:MAG: carbohydrate-binding family 9-like protein [Pyrinomonadaceae bacterium]